MITTAMTGISEAQAFLETLDKTPPTALTACTGWTVHELTAHVAAGADEIARLVEAYGEGLAVPETRGFEEREAPYRDLPDAKLRQHLFAASGRMLKALGVVLSGESDAVVPFTGMPFTASTFAMHSRSELALHRWDIVGDDELSESFLSQPELTQHAVEVMGDLLLRRGCAQNRISTTFAARLRVAGSVDVVVAYRDGVATLEFSSDADAPAVETAAASRLLLLWGRRPSNPSRVRSTLPAGDLPRLQRLLSGF